jgi:hypothetical protein
VPDVAVTLPLPFVSVVTPQIRQPFVVGVVLPDVIASAVPPMPTLNCPTGVPSTPRMPAHSSISNRPQPTAVEKLAVIVFGALVMFSRSKIAVKTLSPDALILARIV